MLTKPHLILKNWASNFQTQEQETRMLNKYILVGKDSIPQNLWNILVLNKIGN